MSRRLLRIALGVVIGLLASLVLILVGSDRAGPPVDDPVSDAFLPESFPAPPLALADPDGAAVDLERFRGSVVALFFGYTYCPDVCPLTLAVLGRLQEERTGPGARLEVIFVSVDPERDTPDRLRRFAEGLPGRIHALSGEGDLLRSQAMAYGVDVRRPGAPEEIDPAGPVPDYTVDHTARTFILDPAGRVVATLPAMVSATQARAVVDRVSRGDG